MAARSRRQQADPVRRQAVRSIDIDRQFSGVGQFLSGPIILCNTTLYKGAATIAKAREVYGIADPSKPQLDLFGMLGGRR